MEASVARVFHARYEVVRKIAAGGMATVYEVIDRATRRRRALKVMHASLAGDAEMRSRFKLEARVTADIESDHIVQTLDVGIDAETGSPFLVMDLLRGEDLHDAIERRGRLPAAEVVALLTAAAKALDRTHEAGIVHRDLKPKNVFLASREEGLPLLKILDFGIAKFVAQSTQSMQTTLSLGTPMYMSPEQIRGDGTIDHRADVYSLAHLAYTMLVGEAYWSPEVRASPNVYGLLVKLTGGTIEPPSARAAPVVALSSEFDAWFARATAPDAASRFDSAGELVRELARVLGTSGAPASPTADPLASENIAKPSSVRDSSPGAREGRWRQTFRARVVLAALAALALVGAVVAALIHHGRAPALAGSAPMGSASTGPRRAAAVTEAPSVEPWVAAGHAPVLLPAPSTTSEPSRVPPRARPSSAHPKEPRAVPLQGPADPSDLR